MSVYIVPFIGNAIFRMLYCDEGLWNAYKTKTDSIIKLQLLLRLDMLNLQIYNIIGSCIVKKT